VNAKKWEMERSSLKADNAALTSTLQDYTYNVEEWKGQLSVYKEQNLKLKQQISDAENACGDTSVNGDLLHQIDCLRKKAEFYATQLSRKEEEIQQLRDIVNNKDLPKVGSCYEE
jgi:chromosome segregation ATPase